MNAQVNLNRSLRSLQRLIRYRDRELIPARLWHQLNWYLQDREYILRWTNKQLQLDSYYWLFVLGINNSGTTMLSKILSSHPLIRSLPSEGQKLTSALPKSSDYGVTRLWSSRPDIFYWTEDSDPEPAIRASYDWAYFYETRPGILMNKSPQHSLRSLWLQRNFQPSRFLAIARSPYAVCEGIKRRQGYSIEAAAQHWKSTYERILADKEHLKSFCLLKYEDFCADPIQEIERIEQFLDLSIPFERSLLKQPVNAHNMDTRPQVIQDFNAKSLERLSPQEIEKIGAIAAPVMAQLGYELK